MKQKVSGERPPGTECFKSRVYSGMVGSQPKYGGILSKKIFLLIFLNWTMVLPSLDATGQTHDGIFDTICFERDGRNGYAYHVFNSTTTTIVSKYKERIRNEDGSFSIANTKEIEINWDQSFGYILRQSDTIGRFYVVPDPRFVGEFDPWNREIDQLAIQGVKSKVMGRREFALYGELFGQETLVIYNVENNLMYLFKENELRAIFQPEQRRFLVRKKKIAKPVLLVKNTLDEDVKTDVLLLSMVGQRFMVSSAETE